MPKRAPRGDDDEKLEETQKVTKKKSMKESGPKKLERDRRKRAREAREAREKARAAPPARTTRHNTTTNSRDGSQKKSGGKQVRNKFKKGGETEEDEEEECEVERSPLLVRLRSMEADFRTTDLASSGPAWSAEELSRMTKEGSDIVTTIASVEADLLGAGRFGVVMPATDRHGWPVAIKGAVAGVRSGGVMRVVDDGLNELSRSITIRALSAHPNIGRVLSTGAVELDGLLIGLVVMERLGKALDDREEVGQDDEDDRYERLLGGGLMRGIGHLAAHGLTHGDIKPDNLRWASLSDGSEVIKILDFGLVRRADDAGDIPPTKTGLRWLAPELIENMSRAQTLASDVWSVGNLLLGRLLSTPVLGINPPRKLKDPVKSMERKRLFALETHRKFFSGRPEDVAPRIEPLLSEDLEINPAYLWLLVRMVAFTPADRPSMVECIEEFDRLEYLYRLKD